MNHRAVAMALILACSLVSSGVLCAQHGNEWIHYNQPYWKFPVYQQGLHRICAETLIQQGFPSGVDPSLIRLIFQEHEVRVKISGDSDGSFDPGDCIEFLGKKNDGWLDSLVYDQPGNIANPYFSLFNDTVFAFITLGPEPGLRTQSINHTNYPIAESLSHCLVIQVNEYHQEYLTGRMDVNGITQPSYGAAEGWMSHRFSKGMAFHSDLITSQVYAGPDAPQASVRCTSASASSAQGTPNHHLQVGWGTPFNMVRDTVYSGYQLNRFEFNLATTSLGVSTTRITHRSIDDLGVAVDNHAVAWVSLRYPHTWNFSDYQEGRPFYVRDEWETGWIHFEVSGVSLSSPRFFLCDHNGLRAEVFCTEENGVYKCLFPVAGTHWHEIRIFNGSIGLLVNEISRVTSSGFFTNYAATPSDSAFLIITHPHLWNAASTYAAYRTTTGHAVRMANIEELYLQFGGGIRKHPLAIARYCDYIMNQWPSPPGHLLLIGKSIHEMTIGPNTGSRIHPERYARNLLPSWGWPSSDAIITARNNTPLYHMQIPTGRIAAEQPQEVLEYLNKVVQHESQPPQRWQKNILHFGGGGNPFEQNLFKGYLSGYEQIARDTSYGARVFTFLKNTTDPIQMNLSDSIRHLIDQGAGVLTFFGHASSTGFDQNLDEPANYNNPGRYPLLIGNSCYTGNIHLAESQSASERFVLAPQRGVIGFIAKPDQGIPVYLDLYTSGLYRHLFRSSYGRSIGQCMKAAVIDFQQAGDFHRENTALTFSLHGDPAIRIYPRPKPDYDIRPTDITFHPSQLSAQIDSFEVRVNVHNLGKAINQPVAVELIRRFPDGTDSSMVSTVARIMHSEMVVFKLPVDPLRAAGLNTFDVLVDIPENLVPELDDYGNNAVYNLPLHITSGELRPVVPYPFAVIPGGPVTLRASTGNALEPPRNYIIQLDTTDTFNSPWKQQHTLVQPGGVVEWTLPFTLTDSTVYFWRCSADSLSPEQPFRWRNSSFQVINGVAGWGQDHALQLGGNQVGGMDFDRDNRKWDYTPFQAALRCEVYGNPATSFEALGTRFMLNLDVQDYSGPGNLPCLMVAVMDPVSLQPWQSNYNGANPENEFSNSMISANARARPEKYFIFEQDKADQLNGLSQMLNTGIPEGHYVLIYTWRYATFSSWQSLAPGLFDAFASLGSSLIAQGNDSVPFIFLVKKGDANSVQEVVGSLINDDLVLETNLEGRANFGWLRSPVIGPARIWEELNWSIKTEDGSTFETEVKLTGITGNGQESEIANWNTRAGQQNLSGLINPDQFATIRLEARLADDAHVLPPQPERWHVHMQPAPECALDPASGFLPLPATAKEGELIPFAMAIRNISGYPMDSLLVKYRVEDNQRELHTIPYLRQAPLLPGEIMLDTIWIDTRGLAGRNILTMEANPIVSASGITDQPEQMHFNNLVQIPFNVEADKANPLLDVTFDGVHILNRDLVSSRPDILIRLDDDNEFLLLDTPADTVYFRIFIQEPDVASRPIYFSDPAVIFHPASDYRNKSKIEYRPEFARDGVHTLVVQARDKSGNTSGKSDYKIEFEVINRPTISEVVNYPNPFSTSTRFVFTLTGSEVPNEMKIQIMTVGGRIVREITQNELGALRIGRNITDYQWDGRDEFGDALANGVYLYRVVARLGGKDLQLRLDGTRSFTTKGFGKMYLLR